VVSGFVAVPSVFRVEAEGVLRGPGGPGRTSCGMDGGGRRSSVYMSNSMLERPMIAPG
jgi:hypothetical protein